MALDILSEDRRIRHPGGLVVGGFGAVITMGAFLLSLPISHQSPDDGVGIADSLFTAASAVTVTGLVVTDTGTTWSMFGQAVLMVLIQIGGLGIMTMAGFVGLAFNRRLGIRSGLLAGTEIGLTDLGVLRTLIRDVVRFVFYSESMVALLFAGRFLVEGEHGFLGSLRLGLFHSISAFNNAGFSTFDGGLERYVGDWFVSLVAAGAFIVGGIGFPVVFELRRKWRDPHGWTLHTKVTLSVTVGLLAAGTVFIGLIEWDNPDTFGALSTSDRILASFFQSATTRTAGFNTIDLGSMRGASWLVMILLMVIGAGSASTGGGIKVSTFALVVKSTLAEFRRDHTTTMFERRIPLDQQRTALALVVAALGVVGTSTFLLTLLHPEIEIAELLFEAASAFGTVGVSTGITESLDGSARLLVILMMFIGRLGPITFGTAVLLRPEAKRYGFAEEELIVG